MAIQNPKVERFRPKNAKKDWKPDHTWEDVTSSKDMPDEYHYFNLVKTLCKKDLRTPFSSFCEFTDPVLKEIVYNTNINLSKKKLSLTNISEMRQLLYFEMAATLHAPKFRKFKYLVSWVRKLLKREHLLKGQWPGNCRLFELRTNLRMYDEEEETGRIPATSKVKAAIEIFNQTSENVLNPSGSYSLDETLTPYHGRNALHTKMNRKPAGEGHLFHNVSHVEIRYSERLELGKLATEKKLSKAELVEQLIGTKIQSKGLPLVSDRGYTTISLLRHLTDLQIPYVGTCMNGRLGGNYPKFIKDGKGPEGKASFRKRLYVYKIKNEPIWLHALYDRPSKEPCIFLSNFHTGEMPQFCTKRPLISEIYNRLMGGVDSFDRVSGDYAISRKTTRWTVRLIEMVLGFLITNSRSAYCVANKLNHRTYVQKHFFMDILKSALPSVIPVTKICFEQKSKFAKQKRCNWTKCKKTTTEPCSNKLCVLVACTSHSVLLCKDCSNNPELSQTLTVRKNNVPCLTDRKCLFCHKKSKITCSVVECQKRVCVQHRAKVCSNCIFKDSCL